jgi:hypothetical protein
MPLAERRGRARRAERQWRESELTNLSQAALLDYLEGLWWAADDPDWDDDMRAYARLSRAEELAIAQAELDRRQRLVHRGRTAPPAYADHGARLLRLTRAIHEQVHLGHMLEDAGLALAPRGRELHSECPVCGGVDRFVIWPPPRSRGWCRQCGWNPDVIAFWRWHEGCGFADAVLALASRYLAMGSDEGASQ